MRVYRPWHFDRRLVSVVLLLCVGLAAVLVPRFLLNQQEVAVSPPVAGVGRFVSPTGTDINNTCLVPSRPCQTIATTITRSGSGDTIHIAAGHYLENLSFAKNVVLLGAGAASTIIDGDGRDSVLQIGLATVTVSGLTLKNGHSLADGGGISNYGTLHVLDSTITGNDAKPYGGGGGIANSGVLTLTNSSVVDNEAPNGGGGIKNDSSGSLVIVNSTVARNQGGGIATTGSLVLLNATVALNAGGGLNGDAVARNTILAANSGPPHPDCPAGTLTSQGYNLIQDGSGCTISGNLQGNILALNAELGPLVTDGGATPVLTVRKASPAVDSGDPAGCRDAVGVPLTTDQRGYGRPFPSGGRCDIGAYEFGAPRPATMPPLLSTPSPSATTPATPADTPTATVAPAAQRTTTVTPTVLASTAAPASPVSLPTATGVVPTATQVASPTLAPTVPAPRAPPTARPRPTPRSVAAPTPRVVHVPPPHPVVHQRATAVPRPTIPPPATATPPPHPRRRPRRSRRYLR